MNDLLPQQAAIERAGKLQALTPSGLVKATYTKQDLLDLEEQIVYLSNVSRFCRIDLATFLNDRIVDDYKKGRITYAERSNLIQINLMRLAARFDDVKPGTLESEVSFMRRWPLEERVNGATVGHYQAIPAGMPQDIAQQLIQDAVDGGWTTTELRLACQSTREQVTVEQPPAAPMGYAYSDLEWAAAEQFCHYHEISHMRREAPNQVVFHSHSGSGVLILDSDTPIRYTVREQSQNTTRTGEHT